MDDEPIRSIEAHFSNVTDPERAKYRASTVRPHSDCDTGHHLWSRWLGRDRAIRLSEAELVEPVSVVRKRDPIA